MNTLFWVGCTGLPYSVGDNSQTLAVQQFFDKFFSDYKLVQFSLQNAEDIFTANVNVDDLIFFHSGGGFGDLYLSWHETRKRIIAKFPRNRIIQLPVSVFYRSIAQFEIDKIFFSDKHNLTILCRHEKDAAMLKANFGCQVEHFPDFAYYLRPEKASYKRKGILFVLRNDVESVFERKLERLTVKLRRLLKFVGLLIGKDVYFVALKLARKYDYSSLLRRVKEMFPEATVKDVQTSDYPITDANREKVVFDVLDLYQQFKLVVTDRFHGLVFAALTDTPSIALPTLIPHKASNPNTRIPVEIFEGFRKRFIQDFKPAGIQSQYSSNTVFDVVKSRRSIRKFNKQPIPLSHLKILLEAGYWSPTAANVQAVGFCSVTNPQLIAQLCYLTSVWLKNSDPTAIIIVYYDVQRAKECGLTLKDWTSRFVWQDSSVAMANMMLTAESLGVKSCWASVLPQNVKVIQELLGLPKEKFVTCMLLLGYSNQKVSLDSLHHGRPLRRRICD